MHFLNELGVWKAAAGYGLWCWFMGASWKYTVFLGDRARAGKEEKLCSQRKKWRVDGKSDDMGLMSLLLSAELRVNKFYSLRKNRLGNDLCDQKLTEFWIYISRIFRSIDLDLTILKPKFLHVKWFF